MQITDQTQGTTFAMPKHAMTSAARQDEILVFCASRSFSASLWEEFGSSVCVEITDIPAFCARVRAVLPSEARFPGKTGPGAARPASRVLPGFGCPGYTLGATRSDRVVEAR